MIDCNFCSSMSKPSYIYAQCNHFICLDCACERWDRKYSFKCCGKITFLEEETCLTLEKMNREEAAKKDDYKENILSSYDKMPATIAKNLKDDKPLKNREIQQSIYLSEFDNKTPEKQQPQVEKKQDNAQLAEMEEIMSDNVYKIKMTFESYRKQLEKREEILLKEVYNKYSEHLAGIKHTVTEEDTAYFKESLTKMINEEFGRINTKEPQGKSDKILQKLQYNQLKMKQKLNRHYYLLK